MNTSVLVDQQRLERLSYISSVRTLDSLVDLLEALDDGERDREREGCL